MSSIGSRRRLAAAVCGALAFGLVAVPVSQAAPAPPPPGGAPTPPVGNAQIIPPLPIPAPIPLPFVPPLVPLPQQPLPFPPPMHVTPTIPVLPIPGPAHVDVVASGMRIPWDIGFLPGGAAIVGDRGGKLRLIPNPTVPANAPQLPGSNLIDIDADLSDLTAFGEGGLSGIAISPDFAQTGTFYTCIDSTAAGVPGDMRLIKWRFSPTGGKNTPVIEPITERLANLILQPDAAADGITDQFPSAVGGPKAERVGPPVFIGPKIAASGFHLDCRPRFGPDGMLWVATGDTVGATHAQDLNNLGGKILRIDPRTGGPAPGNPFLNSPNPDTRLIYTYGHRNPQGLAFQPGTGRVYASEHGTDVDDEVNVLVPGGNYGWDPSFGGDVIGVTTPAPQNQGEFAPMTDLRRYPNAIQAVWSSGPPTVAPSDIEFLTDPRWGPRRGMLAVATLKGATLLLMRVAPNGTITEVQKLAELAGTHGRLRSVETGPDGALYITTSNGFDDKLLRVPPF